jgi:hypothetical protein
LDERLQLVDLYVSADIALGECSDSITFGRRCAKRRRDDSHESGCIPLGVALVCTHRATDSQYRFVIDSNMAPTIAGADSSGSAASR